MQIRHRAAAALGITLIHISCGIAWSSSTSRPGGPSAFGFISGNPRTPSGSRKSVSYRALLVRNY